MADCLDRIITGTCNGDGNTRPIVCLELSLKARPDHHMQGLHRQSQLLLTCFASGGGQYSFMQLPEAPMHA